MPRAIIRPGSLAALQSQRNATNAARRQSASDAAAVTEQVAVAVASIDTRIDEIDGRITDLENPIP
jgi:hypothetical protein